MTTDIIAQENTIQNLAQCHGIQLEWSDIWGNIHPVGEEACRAMLEAMEVRTDTPEAIEAEMAKCRHRQSESWLEPVCVVSEAEEGVTFPVYLQPEDGGLTFEWRLHREDGAVETGRFNRDDLVPMPDGRYGPRLGMRLQPLPPQGYHHLHVVHPHTGHESRMLLVVTPTRCYMPEALRDEEPEGTGEGNVANRAWGPAIQLYSIKSRRNWGMGDFTDLLNILDWGAREGAGMVGLNPIHALFPHNPRHCSPYSPSSRAWFNVLYLDAEAMDDFPESEPARQRVFSPEFQEELERLRNEELVDYEAVGRLKMEIFRLLYRNFCQRHLAKSTDRAREFQDFVRRGGDRLARFALYHALQERFHDEDPNIWGWPVWPEQYRNPDSPAVREFSEANPERVGFYQYLQWQVDKQLHKVGIRSLEKHLPVGLYLDMAVGVDWGGADVWSNQHLFAKKCGVGAPPDEYNQKGQDWGLPPMIPDKMREESYQSFIETLQHNMKYAGALRMDHVMGLMRLYWIPPGMPPSEGAYVHYPFDEILGILALESQRNQCMVIGEDMGTVPEIVRDRMTRWGILSYKVFYFEKEDAETYIDPAEYKPMAAVAVSTHDLPTLAGFWQSEDISIRTELDLYPTNDLRDKQIKDRVMERVGILRLLEKQNLLPEGVIPDPASVPTMTPELAKAVHQLVARTPCKVHMIQLEDMLQQPLQVNLPGTVEPAYPNWRRRIELPLEDLVGDPRVLETTEALRTERPRWVFPEEAGEGAAQGKTGLKIPRATYRFQFNRDFTFRQAAELVPYLAGLGVSHCYASPLLKAREGSQHGYDITDHRELNSEIGSREDFDHFTRVLKDHGMGLIVDIVPNHMGAGRDNPWWMDVLENGRSSLYSDYFDIDWYPLSDPLHGKILLPILGDAYGKVLENGELQMEFAPDIGTFRLHYYEHPVPINPSSYPIILGHRLDVLETRLGDKNSAFLEYQSIVNAFENLPQVSDEQDETPLSVKEDRVREVSVARHRLIALCQSQPLITEFLQENIQDFSAKNDPTNMTRLHRLLESQAYRLANWRVASDEINYRRFFDINDLVALRVEDPRVFNDTHELILDLIGNGQVQGLRVDHPDGLFDPAAYFAKLQQEAAKRLSAEQEGDWSLGSTDLPLYLAIEKILAPFERLPDEWAVHGTTGYDFANAVNGIFVNGDHAKDFTRFYERLLGHPVDFQGLVHYCKMLIMGTTLNSEMSVLAYQLDRISEQSWSYRDFTLHNLRNALMEVVAAFPVYRTYVTLDGPSKKDREYIDWAIQMAKKHSPVVDLSIFDFIRHVLLLEFTPEAESARKAVVRFAMKFQQYTGPVMAKGLEDTTFYRYNRLVSLNEVGGEPQHFGMSVSNFHQYNLERQKRVPCSMLTTSTHDTKRSEDVRARISVLSEMPDDWQKRVTQWRRMNRGYRKKLDGDDAPATNAEYLFYQTLVGVWPFRTPNASEMEMLSARMEQYMLKAAKEAKNHTSWISTNAEYEEALTQFVRNVLRSKMFLDDFAGFQKKVARCGIFNSLAQTLIKLTAPGVPDIYQGTELWDFSLVDPDNRRPVDYGRRMDILRHLLENSGPIQVNDMMQHLDDGRLKLFLMAGVLQFRKQCPDLFMLGEYVPLETGGSYSDHIVAFARRLENTAVITVVPRLLYTMGMRPTEQPVGKRFWKDTSVILPADLSGRKIFNVLKDQFLLEGKACDSEIPVSEILSELPVGFLSLR